jgi:hypothetical protein
MTSPGEQPPPLPAPPQPSALWKLWERSSQWWGDHHRRTADATVLLALGTIALATFSLIQICDLRDQEQRRLRAYVTSNGGGATVSIEPITNKILMHGAVRLHNSGGTPAYNLTVKIRAKIAARDAIPFAEIEPISDEYGPSIMGPGTEYEIGHGPITTPTIWCNWRPD